MAFGCTLSRGFMCTLPHERSTSSLTLCSVHAKTNRYGYRSFSDAVPSVCCSVPREIGHNQSTTAFKTALKAYLVKTDCVTRYC